METHSEHENEIRNIIKKINNEYNINQFDDHILMGIRSLKQLNSYLKELENNGLKINRRTFLRKFDLQNISTLTNYFMVQMNNINDENGGRR